MDTSRDIDALRPSDANREPRGGLRAAELTGAGRGGIATIGLAGPGWQHALGRCFAPAAGAATTLQPGRIYYGRWHGGRADEPDESVVVTPLDDQAVEVHCHGGRAAVAAILDDLAVAGAVIGSWQQWIAWQDDPSPLIAEARTVLAATVTARTAAIALDQARGALHDRVLGWIAQLRGGTAWSEVRPDVQRVLQWAGVGRHLTTPWNVVLAGAPNVGKSSLLNALLGYQRAITFDAPGTTRDVVAAETVIDGWPLRICDTAGMRHSDDRIERTGVDRARRAAAAADLVVVVCDARSAVRRWCDVDLPLPAPADGAAMIGVLNKVDLLPDGGPPTATAAGDDPAADDEWVATVATDGRGIDRLAQRIIRALIPTPPPAAMAVPVTERQVSGLRQVIAAPTVDQALLRLDQLMQR